MENRRKKARKNKLKRKFFLRRLGLLLFIIGLLFFVGTFFSRAFRVEEVQVKGIERMSKKPIDKIMAASKGKNYFFIGKKKIVANLEKIPYIQEAKISYRFPSALVLEIKEELPVGQIFTKSSYLLLNKDLKVLEETRTFDDRLPKITGIQTRNVKPGDNLLDTVKNKAKLKFFHNLFESEIMGEVIGIDVMEQGIQILTKSDVKIVIRSFQDSEYKVQQLEKVYEEVLKSDEGFSTILLDQSDHPIAIRGRENEGLDSDLVKDNKELSEKDQSTDKEKASEEDSKDQVGNSQEEAPIEEEIG